MHQTNNDEPSLTDLVLAAKSGNREDMERVYVRLRPLIRKMTRGSTPALREDVHQELAMELCHAIRRFRPSDCDDD